jgi:hypothetical protein
MHQVPHRLHVEELARAEVVTNANHSVIIAAPAAFCVWACSFISFFTGMMPAVSKGMNGVIGHDVEDNEDLALHG